jgi:hypothetical protein
VLRSAIKSKRFALLSGSIVAVVAMILGVSKCGKWWCIPTSCTSLLGDYGASMTNCVRTATLARREEWELHIGRLSIFFAFPLHSKRMRRWQALSSQ